MNNIYEYKANKYKLKYLKLKQLKNNNQLEGGMFEFLSKIFTLPTTVTIKAIEPTNSTAPTPTHYPLNKIINTVTKENKLLNFMNNINNKQKEEQKQYILNMLLNLSNSIKIIIENINTYTIIKGNFEDIFDNEYKLIIIDNIIKLDNYPLIIKYLDNIKQYNDKSHLIELLLNEKKLNQEQLFDRNKLYTPDIENRYKKIHNEVYGANKKFDKLEWIETNEMKLINKEKLNEIFQKLHNNSNINDYKNIILSILKQYYIIELCNYFMNVIYNINYHLPIFRKLQIFLQNTTYFNITKDDIDKLLSILNYFITELKILNISK
jgi:hypothetical protein